MKIQAGQRNLITDVTGLVVGNASDDRLKSGVTVVTADQPFTASCMVLGGAPGTRETDLLEPGRLVEQVDALVLSGGSAFGLGAADGVTDALHSRGRGFAVGPARVPIVPAAILFDLNNGGDRDWTENPYPRLGAEAFLACSHQFELGSTGAGTGAVAGPVKGGLGSASTHVTMADGTMFCVGALAAVNSFGSPFVPGTDKFWAAPFEDRDEFGGRGCAPAPGPHFIPRTKQGPARQAGANTTIAVIATDLILSSAEAKRLAVSAHDGFARAIVPAHSLFDGDLVFAAATGRAGQRATAETALILAHSAGITMARAIARAVFAAEE